MRWTLSLITWTVVVAFASALGAQQQPATPIAVPPVQNVPAPGTTKPDVNRQVPTAVKVDIVLSRMNGSKSLSSLPYTLNVTEGNATHLRVGSQVPIPQSGPGPAVSYQNVGSSIDCDVRLLVDGRYRVALTMDDSSVAEGPAPSGFPNLPVIRSYRVDNLLVLRSGETTTFNVATDKVSGDTIAAKVTVTALK